MPLHEEPPQISAYILYFQKLHPLTYIYAADNIGSIFFLWPALNDAPCLQ